MMRSLYSGVSGLRNHQTRMDVIGNNIANVNTAGFKASRTIFQDMYSQNMRAASSPGETTGGTNPTQIGLGMTLSTIDTMFTRSAAQVTGATYDLMIENDGFFVIRNGFGNTFEEFYTRAGNFYEDKSHYLVTANGFYLQGFVGSITQGTDPIDSVAATATVEYTTTATGVEASPVSATGYSKATLTTAPETHVFNGYTVQFKPVSGSTTQVEVILKDKNGNTVDPASGGTAQVVDITGAAPTVTLTEPLSDETVTFTMTQAANNSEYLGTARLNGGATEAAPGGNVVTAVRSLDLGAVNNKYEYSISVPDPTKNEVMVTIRDTNSSGSPVLSQTTYPVNLPSRSGEPSADITLGDLVFTFDAGTQLADLDGIVVSTDGGVTEAELGEPRTTFGTAIDRIYVDENLYNISVDKNGNVTGVVKNNGTIRDPLSGELIQVEAEQRVVIARLAIATFDNQQGLEKVGSNLYRETANTGEAQYNSAGTNGAGQINPGALEMSNVDLAQEFTDMIVTQRGFQANSRTITVSDTLLEELINLKR